MGTHQPSSSLTPYCLPHRSGSSIFLLNPDSATIYCRFVGGFSFSCACRLGRCLFFHMSTRPTASISRLDRKKGYANAGSFRSATLESARLSVPTVSLKGYTVCSTGSCAFLTAVECLANGQAACTADGLGNIGSGNIGWHNYGTDNQGAYNTGEMEGDPSRA